VATVGSATSPAPGRGSGDKGTLCVAPSGCGGLR